MISITPQTYSALAEKLTEILIETPDFFNGRIEFDTNEFYSTLTCTLVIYGHSRHNKYPGLRAHKVVPVWWEFSIYADGKEELNDFSWKEFNEYLIG